MGNLRKFLILFAIVAVFIPAVALSAQVSPSSYVKAGSYYGRSDGQFQDTTSKGVWNVENGNLAGPAGQTYYEDFTKYGAAKGISCIDIADGTTCAGDLTTVPGMLTLGDGLKLVQFPIATATLPVTTIAAGLDITGDLTAADGFEVAGAILGASGRPFVIGDDPGFYFCATVKITDVSGTADLQIGFRRAAPFAAAFDDYTDAAVIGVLSGSIYTETIDDNAATTDTDTTDTWADTESKKVCVYVSAAGAVTYKVNGVTPTTTVAFTWDDGDPVIPFVRVLHAADIAEATSISKWEVGYTN